MRVRVDFDNEIDGCDIESTYEAVEFVTSQSNAGTISGWGNAVVDFLMASPYNPSIVILDAMIENHDYRNLEKTGWFREGKYGVEALRDALTELLERSQSE